MPEQATQERLDHQAQEIADLLDELPWCECSGFLVVEEDGEPDASLNQYLQAFDLLVFDGYVTDFMRLVRGLTDAMTSRFANRELTANVSIHEEIAEDPNLVPLTWMVHYHGADTGYLAARAEVLGHLKAIVQAVVIEWTEAEEEDESTMETLV